MKRNEILIFEVNLNKLLKKYLYIYITNTFEYLMIEFLLFYIVQTVLLYFIFK